MKAFAAIALLLTANLLSAAHADELADAIINIQAFTAVNQLEGGHSCKGILVSETQILSINYCILGSTVLRVSNAKLDKWVKVDDARAVANGLVLLTATGSIADLNIKPTAIAANNLGVPDEMNHVKMCGTSISAAKLPTGDAGYPQLNKNEAVSGILYTSEVSPSRTSLSLFRNLYVCIPTEITDAIIK